MAPAEWIGRDLTVAGGSGMTQYDAAMAGVIVAGMVWGAWRGITWQLASIASLVLSYCVAHPLSGQLAAYFPGEPVVARSLAMLAIYFAVSFGVFFTTWLIRATLRQFKFEAFDRYLGMVLGGVEGSLLGLVVTLFVVSLAPQTRGPIFASPTGKAVGQLMAAVGPVLPEEARGVLAPFWSTADPGAASAPVPTEVTSRRDAAASPASLKDLVEEGENRVSKAIADEAAKSVKQAVGGGRLNDGTVERR
jgi:uncharacterized membrane protein required for colicin V production